jgi:hypothetical protein
MADYKELLRRAVEALPENNGAARRAVYEKARAALVGQLRAINPPLAARDITTHRLQLEDCIRQVEQEASEAMIAGMGAPHESGPPPIQIEAVIAKDQPVVRIGEPAPQKALPARGSIEDIIAAANTDADSESPREAGNSDAAAAGRPAAPDAAEESEPEEEPEAELPQPQQEVAPRKPAAQPGRRPLPSIVARAEAAKGRSAPIAFGVPREKPYDGARRGPMLEPRREAARLDAGPRGGQAALVRQAGAQPMALQGEPAVAAAMSAVREVEVEPQQGHDPQSDIDRAIATLDREARGEKHPEPVADSVELDDEDEPAFARSRQIPAGGMIARIGGQRHAAESAREPKSKAGKPTRENREAVQRGRMVREAEHEQPAFPRARAEDRGGMGAVTIFLVVLAVLLVGAGGAGYWAVSQGYLDLGSMFRSSAPAVAEAPASTTPAEPEADQAELATGPGNTATPVTGEPATALEADERLVPEPALSGSNPLPLVPPGDTGKTEERLADTGAEPDSAAAAVAAIDPATVAGSQSLLLEDSNDANTGAVPFSGTVEWSRGTDETGLPTLLAKANIPARNLGVDILIRKNQDPALPASHLMEINFTLSDGFIGGSIAGLPGVLLKNAELVQGTPLIGPSGVRVVANSFLFALSASPEDAATNIDLMTTRKWMDLFVIYATGKRAILTLEKDEEAQQLFADVFDAWGGTETAATADSAG